MKPLRTMLLAAAVAATSIGVFAKGIDDPARENYYAVFKGKKVAFVPIAMGFDLTEGWAAGIKQALEPLGVTVEIRDPNWSTDAGAQAITSLIQEKPDAIVVHNPDVQSYARLLKTPEFTLSRSICGRVTRPMGSSARTMWEWARQSQIAWSTSVRPPKAATAKSRSCRAC
jgi:hypothetical protein